MLPEVCFWRRTKTGGIETDLHRDDRQIYDLLWQARNGQHGVPEQRAANHLRYKLPIHTIVGSPESVDCFAKLLTEKGLPPDEQIKDNHV